MGSSNNGGNDFTPDRRIRENEVIRGRNYKKKKTIESAESLQSKDRAGSTRDPDFGANASAPQMGRSPGDFQPMLGGTGQGAKDSAALSGRSEFGSKTSYNALGKVVSEARGDTRIAIPGATTVGGALVKRAMNETMLQKMIRGGKPVLKSGNIVGVTEDGSYTGQSSSNPYASKPTIEQQTRDDPVTSPDPSDPESPKKKPIKSSGITARRASALSGAASATQRRLLGKV